MNVKLLAANALKVQSGGTSKDIMSSILPLKRPTNYRTNGVLAVSITKIRSKHY
jgi:hypothetical protein